jgi:chorismate-pyruvate lyase
MRRFRDVEDESIHAIAQEAIPEPMQSLLVHCGDMTSRLEGFHGCRMRLTVLKNDREGDLYFREVLLRCDGCAKPAEYGAIEIFLSNFDQALQEEILAGQFPLGGILNANRVHYRSEPQAYFSVQRLPELLALLGAPSDAVLYGRCNVLRLQSGALLARIIEVLPLE